jgi:hypothetical protein
LLGACAAKPAPAPSAAAPAPEAPLRIVVDELPPPPAVALEWPDLPLTPGDWSYAGGPGGSEARFGPENGAHFTLRCDSARRQLLIVRQGASGSLLVRTSYGERALPTGAALPATDPLLDEIAFSRGRFAVQAEGMNALIVPAWPEPARVVEDCRG